MFDGKYTVNQESGCWEWNKIYKFYPKVVFRGKLTRVHRASYEWHIGEIPKGKFVLHKCDNKQCINPGHLFIGSQADNMKDMNTKGRGNYNKSKNHRVSLSHSSRKTTQEQIDTAKTLRNEGHTYSSIGKVIGCHAAQARLLCLDMYKYASVCNG